MHGSTELLAYARSRIERLSPTAAHAELSRDPRALLIDVRTASHRATGGHVPGAHCIDLTVLPWRLDPEFGWRIPEATSFDQRYILMCRHGFSTSLAAWQLGLMGLNNVADIDGGFEAWCAAGLPVDRSPTFMADVRE